MTTEPQRVSRAADLKTRFLTALAIGPAFLVVMYVGGALLAAVLAAAFARLYYEWDRMTRSSSLDREYRCFAGVGILGIIVAWQTIAVYGAIILLLAAGVILAIRGGAFWNAAGFFYIGAAGIAVMTIDGRAGGAFLLLWLSTTVFATDIGAYAVGRYFGGPKMAPSISPKKTWSGFVGGLLGAVVWSFGILIVFKYSVTPGWVLSAIIVSAIGQMGDLLESGLKRQFDVKDTGQLLPGHGGLLDRVDSLLAAVIIVAILASFTPLFAPNFAA
ncbi:MAG: phosphatidate cytidylyltransferase [Pseudomonadota bacterium]